MKTIMRTKQDVLNVFNGKTVVALQVIRLEEAGELLGDKVLVGTADKKVYNDLRTVIKIITIKKYNNYVR